MHNNVDVSWNPLLIFTLHIHKYIGFHDSNSIDFIDVFLRYYPMYTYVVIQTLWISLSSSAPGKGQLD